MDLLRFLGFLGFARIPADLLGFPWFARILGNRDDSLDSLGFPRICSDS